MKRIMFMGMMVVSWQLGLVALDLNGVRKERFDWQSRERGRNCERRCCSVIAGSMICCGCTLCVASAPAEGALCCLFSAYPWLQAYLNRKPVPRS